MPDMEKAGFSQVARHFPSGLSSPPRIPMKRIVILAAAGLAVLLGATFALGNAVGVRDRELLAKDDKGRATMLARSCGKHGRLLFDPVRNEYVCAWTNADGATVTAEIPQYPYLDQVAQR